MLKPMKQTPPVIRMVFPVIINIKSYPAYNTFAFIYGGVWNTILFSFLKVSSFYYHIDSSAFASSWNVSLPRHSYWCNLSFKKSLNFIIELDQISILKLQFPNIVHIVISIYSLHAYTAMVRVTGADIQDILKKIKDISRGRWTGKHKNNIVANMLYTFSTVSGIDT